MDTIEKALRKEAEARGESPPTKSKATNQPQQSAKVITKDTLVRANKAVEKPTAPVEKSPPVNAQSRRVTSKSVEPESKNRLPAGSPITLNESVLRSRNIIVPNEERSLAKEQYRHIKRSILGKAFTQNNTAKGKFSNLVMVTSTEPKEGKTFTAINLAMSIALEPDRKILLVDADVVQPSFYSVLDIEPSLGIVDYLSRDDVPFESILHKTNVKNLSMVLSGSRHHLTNELLASDSMKRLMNELATRYHDRIVLLDTPPLCHTTEAAILASLVGQVIVVVEEGKTTQKHLKEALSLVGSHPDVSLLMNKCSSAKEGSYYGYY
ncbi:XrtA-associated tyrosine autokinase [Aestuariirhabdus litorea]|uniref:non-specific protein-tyrosine kinase n=1 Tax=Aestuariirhabdus litorea TaxID=2528527 RepID=A0A3P3VQ61_9GAMM|nr:XrtA-associated tyrosine autokinase [Aestuariirhabdus litorea]RRJ84584.1 hypothetical protein D0544_05630 [Aestuariirhabdus litorea]RWW97810.1 hypothetical protein DZC74_05625 [Endozoicomonadaceae bacterium GTF-13]